jgi:hypothetical protein
MAASSSTEPSEIPYQAFCTVSQAASVRSIEAIASAASLLDGAVCCPAGRAAGQRFVVAAVADHADRVDLVGFGRAVEIEDDSGARLAQGALDACIGFLGDCLLESRQRIGILRLNTACAASSRLADLALRA